MPGTAILLGGEFGDRFRDRRVLVTGATGFIGDHLTRVLVELGANVTALSRTAGSSCPHPGVIPFAIDLTKSEEVETAIGQIGAELIFHLAGRVTARPDSELVMPMFETNAIGTLHLLTAVRRRGCERFLLVGSSETGQSEARCIPSSPYAASKLVAEIYGRMFHALYGMPVVILRPFLTYGPGQEPTKLIPYTILSLLRGKAPNLTSGDRLCDAVYVEDVVRGLLLAGLASAEVIGQQFDLGTARGVTIRQIVELIARLIGTSASPLYGAVADRPNEPATVADLRHTRSILGWTPRWSLRDGLLETVRWYRQLATLEGNA